MRKVKIIIATILTVAACALALSGCNMFASEYQKGINLAKGASNVTANEVIEMRNSEGTVATNLVGTIHKDTYQRKGNVIYVSKQMVGYTSGIVQSEAEYWYISENGKYLKYEKGNQTTNAEEVEKEVYDSILKKLSTGDIVSEIKYYNNDSDTYSFGFVTKDDVKDFRVLFMNRSVVCRWGFKDKKLIYKITSSSDTYLYNYDEVTIPDLPNSK